MYFNSLDFAIFLPIVFVLYWFVTHKNLKLQNCLILGASYVFYGWWDWRFLSLIAFSTLVDYIVGLRLKKEDNTRKRKYLLWTSIIVNLGFLGFFKYFNFFLDNFVSAFSFFGQEISAQGLSIILPVGISFYTFQTLSYTIDVYKRRLEPTSNFIGFAAFVSFFPQLVAGPIERASNFLPQILNRRTFDKQEFVEGIYLIIYGFFLKLFVADTLAYAVNLIYSKYQILPGGTLILGAIYFTFQIYGDFAGYSKIARGTSKLFGFNLMLNFNFPFFSRNLAEFWNRWHISLNTWFRDYLFVPLGSFRRGKTRSIINILIIFLVSGFWHGAEWTFIVWGAFCAAFYIPTFINKKRRRYSGDFTFDSFSLAKIEEFLRIPLTFIIFSFSSIFFRSESMSNAIEYISRLNLDFGVGVGYLSIALICVVVDIFMQKKVYLKIVYPFMIGAIIAAALTNTQSEFIYFQF